ncbi:MAG: WYL domain-containing protein [marine benthic group bacterium]|nr:WYL domain-containing protein [Gemmatimonadota bacterium]
MPDAGTAGEQLERILYLLPLASREGGVPMTEAAERLGVTVELLQRDLEEVTSRAFYHPAGGADEIQILLEADNLKVYSYKKFDRPTKLSGREMLSLALGLRAAAGEAEPEAAAEIRDLAHRIEMELAVSSAPAEDDLFGIDEGDDEGAAIRSLLKGAARSRTRCRLLYLKPNDPQAEEREVDPYSLVYGSGKWYVIGYCHLRDGIRAFRVDRVLRASLLESNYAVPGDFDPTSYVADGRVFRSESAADVLVQYSSAVAPWVREHGPIEEAGNGRVAVRFTAADPGWVVRHVLSYRPEAEVVAPLDVRAMVIGAASTLLKVDIRAGHES